MSGTKVFSGPPSNKATASTLAAATATLFWTIAAHTFWKSMSPADLTLYITTSTVVLTAVSGFATPESAAYMAHGQQRLAAQAAAKFSLTTSSAVESAIKSLDARLQGMQTQIKGVQMQTQGMQDQITQLQALQNPGAQQNPVAARWGL